MSNIDGADWRAKDAARVACCKKRPKEVLLTGGNALQTQATAALNGGCGVIAISELKSGKAAYIDPDGSFGPLLSFYDDELPARTFRKAEDIPAIDNCRIQIVAAGVKEDWKDFFTKSGPLSGTMARVLPILACDRDAARLMYERLPPYEFTLRGLKKVLEIMEEKFGKDISDTEIPPLTLRFSSSRVDGEYRATNALMVDDDLEAARPNYRRMFRTLLNSAPPTADVLVDEGSGCGLFKVFLAKTTAHYSTLVRTQADRTFLNGLEDNILRLSSDFFGRILC